MQYNGLRHLLQKRQNTEISKKLIQKSLNMALSADTGQSSGKIQLSNLQRQHSSSWCSKKKSLRKRLRRIIRALTLAKPSNVELGYNLVDFELLTKLK